MKLSDNADFWAKAVERAVNMPRAQKQDVVNAVKRKEFESNAFTECLYRLYENVCNNN